MLGGASGAAVVLGLALAGAFFFGDGVTIFLWLLCGPEIAGDVYAGAKLTEIGGGAFLIILVLLTLSGGALRTISEAVARACSPVASSFVTACCATRKA